MNFRSYKQLCSNTVPPVFYWLFLRKKQADTTSAVFAMLQSEKSSSLKLKVATFSSLYRLNQEKYKMNN